MYTYDITMVRHGETNLNNQGAFVGITDDPLNEKGKEQAVMLGKYFSKQKLEFHICLTSPTKRAIQTAEIIAKYIPLEIQIESLIRERNYGIFEGKTVQQVQMLYSNLYQDYDGHY